MVACDCPFVVTADCVGIWNCEDVMNATIATMSELDESGDLIIGGDDNLDGL